MFDVLYRNWIELRYTTMLKVYDEVFCREMNNEHAFRKIFIYISTNQTSSNFNKSTLS